MRRIPDKLVKDYLAASLGYAGSQGRLDAPLLASAITVYQQAASAGLGHLPFFLALDLRALAEQGHEFTYARGELPGYDKMLRGRYENEILNRLLREHRVQQALELLGFYRAQLASHQDAPREAQKRYAKAYQIRAERLALLLLTHLAPHWPKVWVLNPAHLRGRVMPACDDAALEEARLRWDRGRARLEGGPESDFGPLLEQFLSSATGAGISGVAPVAWSQVLELQDLFELEHLEALDKEHLRLSARHIIQVMTSIPELDPHDIELREEESEVESRFMDESYYPTGGFSELTTRGSFENLVLSELIYMGEWVDTESTPTPRRHAIDLFDLRYVESELLFYTRDSGQLQRKRRMVRLVLDLRQPLHIKYPAHPYQLRTLVAGEVLALVRDLGMMFSNDALLFHVHLLVEDLEDEESASQARKLAEVLEILLEAPIQNNLLQLSLDEVIDWEHLGQRKRKTYALFFSSSRLEIHRLAPRLVDFKRQSEPLFTTLINLSGQAADTAAVEQVLTLELAQDAMQRLHREILLDIMHGHRPQVLLDEDEA